MCGVWTRFFMLAVSRKNHVFKYFIVQIKQFFWHNYANFYFGSKVIYDKFDISFMILSKCDSITCIIHQKIVHRISKPLPAPATSIQRNANDIKLKAPSAS